jgi:hypothetical protein
MKKSVKQEESESSCSKRPKVAVFQGGTDSRLPPYQTVPEKGRPARISGQACLMMKSFAVLIRVPYFRKGEQQGSRTGSGSMSSTRVKFGS